MAELHQAALFLPVTATIVVGYLFCTAIYNVYFHPLAKFPGPKLYAASQIPITIKRLSGDEVSTLHSLHLKYGQCVRVAPGELSTINPVASRDIYGHRNPKREVPKDFKACYQKDIRRDGTEGLLTADDETHRRQRKIFSASFSERAIREQEPLFHKYTNLFVKKLGEVYAAEGKVDMVRFLNFVAFDFTADLVFGDSLNLLENMDYIPFVSNISAAVKFSALRKAIRSFPYMDSAFEILLPASMKRKRRENMQFSDDRVNRRLEKKVTDHPDLWTHVLQAEDTGSGLTLGEMHQNSLLFLMAGTDTTASLLSALTYLLCQNPDKMKILVDEIRSKFTSPDEMNTVSLPQLEYLQMCIDEGLRVYPPVPGGLPRRVTSTGASLDGQALPPDAVVYYAHYAAYHSPTHFTRPEEFCPERWASKPATEFANDRREALSPFSSGPRDCIGKSLAYHEMRFLLAKFLWHFDVELCEESRGWINQKAFLVGAKTPLYVKLARVVRESGFDGEERAE